MVFFTLYVNFEQGNDGRVMLFWGLASDGSVVVSDNLEVIKSSCSKSFAPFPTGMYHRDNSVFSLGAFMGCILIKSTIKILLQSVYGHQFFLFFQK